MGTDQLAVGLTGHQLELLQHVQESLALGSPSEALLLALEADPLPGASRDTVSDVPPLDRPAKVNATARRAHELVIEPGTGKAVELRRGQVLEVEQVVGGQCADFNCFNLHDRREHMSVGRTHTMHGIHPSTGDFLWSAPPRERPMLGILVDSAGEIDTLFPRCTEFLYSYCFDLAGHANCQDIQAEAQREYHLTPDEVHDSCNLFMRTGMGEGGFPSLEPTRARAGDRIEMLAMMDVLAVTNVCADDLWPTNNFDQRPLRLVVREASDEELSRFDGRRETRRFSGQRAAENDGVSVDGVELRRDPSYAPTSVWAPIRREQLTVRLGAEHRARLARLRGATAMSDGEIIRAAFLHWWLARVDDQARSEGRATAEMRRP